MIDAGPSLQAAKQLSAASLARYLRATGWIGRPSRVAGVTIFSKTLPEADTPVRVILPEVAKFTDEHRRVADALRTIEAIEDRSIAAISDAIRRMTAPQKRRIAGSRQGSGRTGARPKKQQQSSLTTSYPVSDLDGTSDHTVAALKALRIQTTDKLLDVAKRAKGRRELASRIGISEKRLLRLVNQADRMRIKGMGREYSALLEAAGVVTLRELRYRNPANLAKLMADANAKRKNLLLFLPSVAVVARWIEAAKRLTKEENIGTVTEVDTAERTRGRRRAGREAAALDR